MRILVAEDNPVFRLLLVRLLEEWGYEVCLARDGWEAWDLLRGSDAPKLAVLDWMMPGMDGLQICRRIRQEPQPRYTYTILLTARNQSTDLIEGMEAGADDYVTKPLQPQELRVRLRAGQRIAELQAELLATQEALRQQATHDCLTGLLNRGAIFARLSDEVERGRRESRAVGALMVDIDHFKAINDHYGHAVGDRVLTEIGRVIRESLRTYDAAGRYGGEEFLLVLPGCGELASIESAERIRRAVAEGRVSLPGNAIAVTCSVGAAWALPDDGVSPDQIAQRADAALYEAKRAGRNCIAPALRVAALP